MDNVPKPGEDTNSTTANHDEELGSVDYYAGRLRNMNRTPGEVAELALAYIDIQASLATDVPDGAGERVERIRNILAAAALVSTEMTGPAR